MGHKRYRYYAPVWGWGWGGGYAPPVVAPPVVAPPVTVITAPVVTTTYFSSYGYGFY